MPEQFHRPVRRPSAAFDNLVGSADSAETVRVAHATASALLTRAREDSSGESAERLIAFTAEHGIDDIAELWAQAPAVSLPGALLYERGRVQLASADALVAGAPVPASPDEMVALIDTILRGVFRGDFSVALDRAAAFCRVQVSGATHLADDYEATEPERATDLTTRARRLHTYANDLGAAAGLWRVGGLT
jgi:hypothetical protein